MAYNSDQNLAKFSTSLSDSRTELFHCLRDRDSKRFRQEDGALSRTALMGSSKEMSTRIKPIVPALLKSSRGFELEELGGLEPRFLCSAARYSGLRHLQPRKKSADKLCLLDL
jgi:hypothetical protein